MPKRRHPKKDVEEALAAAEESGWRIEHRLATSDYAKSRRSPTTLLRLIRAESAYPDVLRPRSGIPRLSVGALNGIAKLLRYPQSY